MSFDSDETSGKGRVAVPSAIKGNFIAVSPRRHRSPSPRKHKPNKSVQINLNLTENQMDRLTDVFASNSDSPSRRGRTDNFTRSRSPVGASNFAVPRAHKTHDYRENHPQGTDGQEGHKTGQDGHESDSTTFSELMPNSTQKATDYIASNIAERRRHQTPAPVHVEDRRQYTTLLDTYKDMPPSSVAKPVANPVTPDNLSPTSFGQVDSSSIYSQQDNEPSPLHIQRDDIPRHIENVLQSYSGWKGPNAPALPPGMPNRGGDQEHALHRGRLDDLKQPVMDASQIYSPLRPYFAFKEMPLQKIAGKTLIREQGWLERPNNTPEHKKDSSPKKPGLLDSLKKIAKEMTESKANRRPRDSEKDVKSQQVTISLDPREQSLLYCELEFHVSNALNTYITNELNHGRLNPDKLKKVADGWNQKGRPRVIGFRFDLETQLELVHLHINEFRFFGRRQGNPVEIAGLLHAMKVNARAMRTRTYCQPDSVVAKQLVDSQSFCNTIGCSDAQQIAIAEIAQFFKVIVEREQAYRERLARENRATILPHIQGTRQWEAPQDVTWAADGHGRLHYVPEDQEAKAEAHRYKN
ncbi:hypothetical protein CCHL11_01656 [Colletotrichum chlorophyti]|uniref:Uncharacterized protein n=1 Tax=Colletotrichum chlorophyti TaxID=708187 RepID=A0A1Q8RY04_9PEZI|nr:hypothetical protein CCHL11_01656 [Colletotrichum chlorophyti]